MATQQVFDGDVESNAHFKEVGRALGLVRIKGLHLGQILDLKTQLKDTENDTANANKS